MQRPTGTASSPMTMTAHLNVTRYMIPQGQGLQLLVGQLRDITADVHDCPMYGGISSASSLTRTDFEFEPTDF